MGKGKECEERPQAERPSVSSEDEPQDYICLTATEDEEFELMISIAAGKPLDEVEDWVRDHFTNL